VNEQDLAAENAWLKRTLDGVRRSAFEIADLLTLVLQETNAGEELRATTPSKLMEAGFTRSQIGMLQSLLEPLRNFSWVLPGELAGAGRPHTPTSCKALAAEGVKTLLTLTEDALPAQWTSAAGLETVHIPVSDMGAPSPAQLDQAIQVIDDSLAAGKPIAVHCLGGIGRTGTVLAAYLVHRGLDAGEAIAEVRRLRHPSIETLAQEEAVRLYAHRSRETASS
jgi:atypical dual specificity phosphatase